MNGSDEDKLWIARVEEIVDGLDTTVPDQFDVRIEQLRNTIAATAALVLSLAEGETDTKTLLANTIDLAKKVTAAKEKSKT